ncbi:MAG: dihydrofolate reductase [Paludibacteraceae bacterium]|nr:dihydrofolate reductase [Paludibacteraceae bacterium]
MKNFLILSSLSLLSLSFSACASHKHNHTMQQSSSFQYVVDRFADLEVLRYKVPGFETLSLNQKLLIYWLSKAAEEGRDILFDQNGAHNITVRNTLEAIYLNFKGDRNSSEFLALETYLKRILFSNGIHHHYGCEKFQPEFSESFFRMAFQSVPDNLLKLHAGQSKDSLLNELIPVIFDPAVDSKRVNQTQGDDLLLTSACNYYQGVTQKEAEEFYNAMKKPDDTTPVSYGMNSRLVKRDGVLIEEVWKVGGRYSKEIEKIVFYLQKALPYAENQQQKKVIETLIQFYQTGDLATFDEYSILWVHDTDSRVDFVNGFIETYGDPLDIKASWESIVNFKDLDATQRTSVLSANAQWFEDHSPVDSRFKKKEVKGVSAKVITMAYLGGDCYPATPIGINLPNANWIRQIHGSKSVTIENITNAYDHAARGNGFSEEFMYSNVEINRKNKYGYLADNLHTDLHECLGHGSGQLLPGVSREALKAYGSTIEEARADLFGLYYTADHKMIELGLLPDKEAYKAEYYGYMMNGLLTQLTRIKPGDVIEEAHMRNRALIAHWVFEKGHDDRVVELVQRDGKTFVRINDYKKLRSLFGELLAEVQRIRSEGDYEAARLLVENYGVKVNPLLHQEILQRYQKLHLAPYKGFVNPTYHLLTDNDGKPVDVSVSYSESFLQQQLRYDGLSLPQQ